MLTIVPYKGKNVRKVSIMPDMRCCLKKDNRQAVTCQFAEGNHIFEEGLPSSFPARLRDFQYAGLHMRRRGCQSLAALMQGREGTPQMSTEAHIHIAFQCNMICILLENNLSFCTPPFFLM